MLNIAGSGHVKLDIDQARIYTCRQMDDVQINHCQTPSTETYWTSMILTLFDPSITYRYHVFITKTYLFLRKRVPGFARSVSIFMHTIATGNFRILHSYGFPNWSKVNSHDSPIVVSTFSTFVPSTILSSPFAAGGTVSRGSIAGGAVSGLLSVADVGVEVFPAAI